MNENELNNLSYNICHLQRILCGINIIPIIELSMDAEWELLEKWMDELPKSLFDRKVITKILYEIHKDSNYLEIMGILRMQDEQIKYRRMKCKF